MNFSTKLFLPILKKEIRIEPICNRYYFNLIKYITNDDEEGIKDYLEYIISQIVVDKDIINDLSNLEKFLILISSKSFSSGNKIQISGENQVKTDILISSIIKNILTNIENYDFNNTIIIDNIQINLNLPKKIKLKDEEDIYKEIINEIKIDEESIKFFLLTDFEKNAIINSIPISLNNYILQYIKKIQETLDKIVILFGGEKRGFADLKLNVFDNSLFYFLKSLFNDDLKNFYELQFILINKISFTYDHFLSLTPNDCKIFINLYNEDIKKQQEEQKSSNASMPSLPSMPRMPSMPSIPK